MSAVLVAEDDPGMLSWYGDMLRRRGHDVYLSKDESEAVTLLRRMKFDLVFSDIFMKTERGGLDVLQAARERDPSAQVVLITGQEDAERYFTEAKEQGVKEILRKDDREFRGKFLGFAGRRPLRSAFRWTDYLGLVAAVAIFAWGAGRILGEAPSLLGERLVAVFAMVGGIVIAAEVVIGISLEADGSIEFFESDKEAGNVKQD